MQSSNRLTGTALVLLIQAFVLAGLIHPCCLDEGGVAHVHPTATQGHAHGIGPSEHEAGQPADPDDEHDDHDCGAGEGGCALCCQMPGNALVPQVVLLAGSTDAGSLVSAPWTAATAPLPPTPDFLMPFPNGPPSTSAV